MDFLLQRRSVVLIGLFLYVRIDRLATMKGVTMSKYLTYEERLEIQQGLKNQLSFGKIAISIGKDRTTVSKEIKKYAFERPFQVLCKRQKLI